MAEIRYDVALSFAGEDRPVAQELATRLVAENYRVFYDEFHQADLWGEDLARRLQAVYGEQSRYCVILVSENYADKVWTRLEFSSALAAAVFGTARDAYVLPLRLDDIQLPGLLPTIGYVDLRNIGLDEVVELLVQKIGPPSATEPDESADVAGAAEALAICRAQLVEPVVGEELRGAAMLPSMRACRDALRGQVGFVRPRAARQLVASIIAELDLVERVDRDGPARVDGDTSATVDGANRRVVAAMRALAELSGVPLGLPASTIDSFLRSGRDPARQPSGIRRRTLISAAGVALALGAGVPVAVMMSGRGTDEGRLLATLPFKLSGDPRLMFSPDGRVLATVDAGTRIKFWDMSETGKVGYLEPGDAILGAEFGPDSTTMVLVLSDYTVRLWDVGEKREIGALPGIKRATFSPDGRFLATAHDDTAIRLWNVPDLSEEAAFGDSDDLLWGATFSPNSELLAASTTGQSFLWDVRTRQQVVSVSHGANSIASITFSPDSRILAGSSGRNGVLLWDMALRRDHGTIKGHADYVFDFTFSPNGTMLTTSCQDETVKLWDVRSKQEIATLTDVWGAEFSPDGKILAARAVADDGMKSVTLWDIGSRQRFASLTGHSRNITIITFNRDGDTLASISDDHTVRLWNTRRRA